MPDYTTREMIDAAGQNFFSENFFSDGQHTCHGKS